MGVCVIGGMMAASVIGIFFVPASFYFVERITGGKSGGHGSPAPAPGAAPGGGH
jgi:HAE1 family hydrophobic/amphiphilic exporter-1